MPTSSRFAVTAALLLAACGGDRSAHPEPVDPAGTATVATDTAASPSPPAEPRQTPPAADTAAPADGPFHGTVGPTDRRPDATGVVAQTAVRAARQEGYDRLVLEFAGRRVPGYRVEYIDRPVRQCGSGAVVPLAGDAGLRIRVSPARAHDDAGNATLTERALAPRLPVLRELKLTCDFEAQLEWVLGLAQPNRFRVLELREPPRLVVDVLH